MREFNVIYRHLENSKRYYDMHKLKFIIFYIILNKRLSQ